VGETKTINIAAEEAYGPHRTDLTQQVPRQQLPADMEIQVGQRFQIGQEENKPLIVQVTEVSDASVTLDANHPLAGKDLVFDIELMAIA
jgi:peptidylprolyl isomerase